jgi:hypothetical protein
MAHVLIEGLRLISLETWLANATRDSIRLKLFKIGAWLVSVSGTPGSPSPRGTLEPGSGSSPRRPFGALPF